jgi:ketosteroid isomerase-like protein
MPEQMQSSSRATDEIIASERAWMEAWQLRDRETCERILADDFVLTSARGNLVDRQQWLEGAMEAFACEAFVWDDILVRQYGDVAVVNARAHQKATVAGQDWSGLFLITDVWVKRDGEWRVVSRHGSGPLRES